MFYRIQLYPLSQNIFRKWSASYFLFIHEHLIIVWFYCCNDTFTDVRFTSLLAKNNLEEYKLFYAVRISISLAILSEIFIHIGYFF